VKLLPEKLKKYPFAVLQAQAYFIAMYKNVNTVIKAKTREVFKSLFIGLRYVRMVGEIEAQNQSIKSQNKFQNNIITKNQAIRGKNDLENFLS
jgi:hypothetical protein